MAKQASPSQVSQSARVLYRLLADAASRTVVGATDRSTFDLVEKAADADRVLFSPKGRLSRTVIEQAWKELVEGGYVRGRRFKRPAAPLAGAGAKAPGGATAAAPATRVPTAKRSAATPTASKPAASKPAAAPRAAAAKPVATAATKTARKATPKRPERATTAQRPAKTATSAPATRPAKAAKPAKAVRSPKAAPAAAARRRASRTVAKGGRGAGGRVQAAERELSQLDQRIGRLEGDLAAAQRKRAALATRLAEIDRLLNDLG